MIECEKHINILVVGSMVMDIIVSTERFPEAGETVLGCGFKTAPGGKGANQAVQASLLGAKVSMFGCVGLDTNGDELISSLSAAGVDIYGVRRDKNLPTAIGNVQLELQKSGKRQNKIVVVSGANMSWKQEDIERIRDKIQLYNMVILQLEIPMWVNEAVAKMAYDANVPVLLNPAPADKISPALLKHLTYIAPNETEASAITGVDIRRNSGSVDIVSVENAAKELIVMGVRNVVITLGDSGAFYTDGKRSIHYPCVKLLKPIDPTAAGDSFVGAFAFAMCKGMNVTEAMRLANATAAITVSRLGAQPSLPNIDEVSELISKMEA